MNNVDNCSRIRGHKNALQTAPNGTILPQIELADYNYNKLKYSYLNPTNVPHFGGAFGGHEWGTFPLSFFELF